MKTNPIVGALLALEDDPPDSLFATVPGTDIQLWPLLRTPLANAMAEQHQNRSFGPTARASTARVLVRAAREQLPRRHSSRSLPAADSLFVVNGGTLVNTRRGTENWLVDDFAKASTSAVVLQDLPLGPPLARSRPAFRRTYTFSDAIARVTRRIRTRPMPPQTAVEVRRLVDELIGRLAFPLDPAAAGAVASSTLYRARRAVHTIAEFDRVLDRVMPARIVMESAAYGDRAPLIALAKARGIAVLEPQHGWIGTNHTAYNFGAAMRDARLSRTLPDALLTFGDYWSEALRFPGATPAIGKPGLDESTRSAPALADRPLRVLVVSSRFDDERLIRLTLGLRAALPPAWDLRFRPHPGERHEARARYAELMGHPGIQLDDEGDVNDSLGRSRAVVGFSSTVLFEALAFGCHVEVIDSALADEYVAAELFGERIGEDIAPAAARILTSPAPASGLVDRLWQPGAVENYRRYIRGGPPARDAEG